MRLEPCRRGPVRRGVRRPAHSNEGSAGGRPTEVRPPDQILAHTVSCGSARFRDVLGPRHLRGRTGSYGLPWGRTPPSHPHEAASLHDNLGAARQTRKLAQSVTQAPLKTPEAGTWRGVVSVPRALPAAPKTTPQPLGHSRARGGARQGARPPWASWAVGNRIQKAAAAAEFWGVSDGPPGPAPQGGRTGTHSIGSKDIPRLRDQPSKEHNYVAALS